MFGSKKRPEVLVVGAGPVGLFGALLLARHGVRVRIVDAQTRPATRSYALALHPRSLQLLDEVDLAAEVLRRGRRIDRVAIYDGEGLRAELDLGVLAVDFPFLVVLPQRDLEELLERRLGKHGVRVGWNQRVAGLEQASRGAAVVVEQLGKDSAGYPIAGTVWVVDRTVTLQPSFVVGADGKDSTVRQALGIGFEEQPGRQRFAVFEGEGERPSGEVMRVAIDGETTDVFWPMAGNGFRWAFETSDEREAADRRTKSRLLVTAALDSSDEAAAGERLERLIAEHVPWPERPGGTPSWWTSVEFERRLAPRWGDGRAWLAGDAAHLAGPVGVQSMNVGLREVHDLVTRLRTILNAGGDLDLLERYDRERGAEWRRLLGAAPVPVPGADPWFGDNAARLLPCLPASGAELDVLLHELGLAWRDEPARGRPVAS